MNLYKWATKWGIDPRAIADLRLQMGLDPSPQENWTDVMTEAGVSQRERLAAAREGGVLWRNNVGAMQDDSGRVVRYGLANESKAVNQKVKSSDLIGITPRVIEPYMIGQIIGQFTARETKRPGWTFTGNDHELAQMKFIQLVVSMGGDARFSTGVE